MATETSEVSSALVPGETLMDLDVPVEDPGHTLISAEQLCECSLSTCPDSGTKDSNVEDGVSHRRFSRLLSERISASRPLLARVQRHWTPAMASSSAAKAEDADGPHALHSKEQGTVLNQYVAIMRDMLHKDVTPPLNAARLPGRSCCWHYLRRPSYLWRCRFCLSIS